MATKEKAFMARRIVPLLMLLSLGGGLTGCIGERKSPDERAQCYYDHVVQDRPVNECD
jgi:hypothetical protein